MHSGIGIGAVALVAAAVLAAGPAAATSSAAATATTWTVHPGGAIAATAGKTTVTDTKTGTTASCESSRMSGALRAGSGLPGAGIGTITAAAFRCPTPIGYYTLTPRGLPWHLNLSSYDRGTGTSRGTISHVELAFSVFGTSCSAVINGTSGTAADGVAAFTYSDHEAQLAYLPAGGHLHWYDVSHCVGLLGNGDPATLSAVYAISPAQSITSP
jgi:hypothetical protein